jgi:DNA-binding transcriptional regulator YdaS (Cro superfamily)
MIIDATPHQALLACLEIAGSQPKLAAGLGCSQPAVWKMLQVRRISVPYVLRAEELYSVSRHVLRPDIYGPQPGLKAAANRSGTKKAEAVHGLSSGRG